MDRYFSHLDSDTEAKIIACARVSSSDPSNTDVGLLRYLIKNKHWSPFEMVQAVAKIETSRTIAHQILRHRSFSFQEFSQRYAEATDVIIYPGRIQAKKNRQSSVEGLDPEVQEWWLAAQESQFENAKAIYQTALAAGIAKECARFILPEATKTSLFMAGTIRSWIHYFELRCDEHTQLEHREIALVLREDMASVCPTIAEACGWGS